MYDIEKEISHGCTSILVQTPESYQHDRGNAMPPRI
jgi:hypothetical protein